MLTIRLQVIQNLANFRCTIGGEHYVSMQSNLRGFYNKNVLLVTSLMESALAKTKEHITGDAEPNGFTRRVTYDATLPVPPRTRM